jgi:hypothetical protein
VYEVADETDSLSAASLLIAGLIEAVELHNIARTECDPEETEYGYRSEDYRVAPH